MERKRFDRSPSVEIVNGDARAREPDYSSRVVQDALEQLASIDLIELCNEAKIERCRATRDLSSCGRYVQHVLNSCGHASLCAECSQRCDVCPICRTSIPNNGSQLRLRLFYKCIEAGLISKRHDDRFQEREGSGEHLMADIQRLFSLFDVALENNLVSLICHYVTDVCMDENAVSSDPVLAFLLDEVVVKDWCKQTFKSIICDLREKYSLGVEEMPSNLYLFQKLSLQLTGISSVLEVMVSSFKESISAQLDDLHHLLEKTMRAKQHLEVMVWCSRHGFLKNVQSSYSSFSSWALHVCERKTAAVKRAWPDISSYSEDSAGSHGSLLFIEQALSNLGIEQSYTEEREEVDISCLQDGNSPLYFRSRINETNMNQVVASYPFANVRAAADILFLHGTSDMVVAKRAIFLYYLFDRHWTRPDGEWKHLVEDFAISFGISRHSLLESFIFFLLDDHTDRAVEEASHLLSEIAATETHPKIAQVLLERQRPDVGLNFSRCAGRDGLSVCANSEHVGFHSFSAAVTAVRVRIECGLLTEAFMYQRMHCSKAKEALSKNESTAAFPDSSKSDTWAYHVEVLVTEICQLCIRRNLVDRMIELPWNSGEEKYLHKCLFDHACQNPASTSGSLLVVFYLQRYRYIEAYQVDCKLQHLERDVSETAAADIACRIKSISQWRATLVQKSLDLLPEGQRQQVMTGSRSEDGISFPQDVQMLSYSNASDLALDPSSLPSPTTKPSIILQENFKSVPSKRFLADTPSNFGNTISNNQLVRGKKSPSVLQRKLLAPLGSPTTRLNSAVDGLSSVNPRNGEISPSDDIISRDMRWTEVRQGFQSGGYPLTISAQSGSRSVALKELKASASKAPRVRHHFQVENNSYGMKVHDSVGSYLHITRSTNQDQIDVMDTSYSNGFQKESFRDHNSMTFAKQNQLDKPWSRLYSEETNPSTSLGKGDFPVEDSSMRIRSRWRSDESSGDEADNGLERRTGGGTSFAVRRHARLSRR